MYPYARWLSVVLRRRPQRGPSFLFHESRLRFRVWPGDLDFFGHMNNGRYLTLMDSGRFDLIARLGMLPLMRERKWISVLGAATIRFQRPLGPFRRFELVSRIVGWDEKWFFVEQTFVRGGKTIATSVVRGLFRAPGRSIPSVEVLEAIGAPTSSPRLPAWVAEWSRLMDAEPRATQPV